MAKKATPKDTPKPDKKKSGEDPRSRTWACIIYPESAPADFQKRISDAMIDGFLSPLHTDPAEQEQMDKKPHFHFLAKWETMKSREQVKEVFDTLGGVGQDKVSSFRAYARYLCHLDQPDKKTYEVSQVVTFGSLDYLETIEAASDRYRIIEEMQDFCDTHYEEIRNSFARLCKYCRKNDKPEWFRHLCDDSARVMTDYLRSAQWEREQEQEAERFKMKLQAIRDAYPGGTKRSHRTYSAADMQALHDEFEQLGKNLAEREGRGTSAPRPADEHPHDPA